LEQKTAQKVASPSESGFQSISRVASTGQFKCQSENQTPLKTFKTFPNDKVFNKPAFVLPNIQSK